MVKLGTKNSKNYHLKNSRSRQRIRGILRGNRSSCIQKVLSGELQKFVTKYPLSLPNQTQMV